MRDERGWRDAGVDASRSLYDMNESRLSAFDAPMPSVEDEAIGEGGCERLRGMPAGEDGD